MVASFFNDITSAFASAAGWFYQIGADIAGWVWPFKLIAPMFFALGGVFDNLVWSFLDFRNWALSIEQDMREFISRIDVLALIRPLLDDLANLWGWITQAPSLIWNYITSWWAGTWGNVQSWVNASVNNVLTVVNGVSSSLGELRGKWDNFWTKVYPDLVHSVDLQAIIKGWFDQYEPFWRGWQDMRDQVLELFADPEKWLLERIESMIARFL